MLPIEESQGALGLALADLPNTERLLLSAIRSWSAYHTDLTGIWGSLDRAFTQEGLRGVLSPFHRLMTAVFAGLKYWPDIRCPVCPRLGIDEARLLNVLSCVQRHDEFSATQELVGLVERRSARIALLSAVECAEIMTAAGATLLPGRRVRRYGGRTSNVPVYVA